MAPNYDNVDNNQRGGDHRTSARERRHFLACCRQFCFSVVQRPPRAHVVSIRPLFVVFMGAADVRDDAVRRRRRRRLSEVAHHPSHRVLHLPIKPWLHIAWTCCSSRLPRYALPEPHRNVLRSAPAWCPAGSSAARQPCKMGRPGFSRQPCKMGRHYHAQQVHCKFSG